MRDYWDRIEDRIREVSLPEDRFFLRSREFCPGTKCELCGKTFISHVYRIVNERSGYEIKMGSDCVGNFRIAFKNVHSKLRPLIFPYKYQEIAGRFNEKIPYMVRVQYIAGVDTGLHAVSPDFVYSEDEYQEPEEDLGDGVPEGLDPDEIDWESIDYE